MSNIAIKVENLSKQFFIGAKQASYSTLRETINDAFIGPFRKAANLLRGKATGAAQLHEEIWALKDISFEIKQGEVVGIIGRNGAGKSTLLKVLSRITEPTTGYAEIHGRIGSLLEVGTGFHPELTGRENIYLNGAILGMTKNDIILKFDEMVAFAEVEKFIDTPVKHYSSGMYLRLAFAVAAHLEPEILLVDEVLAVGDASFQKKCLGKMGDVAKEGRTVLFVSHNMAAIQQLCTRAFFIQDGNICLDSNTSDTVLFYLDSARKSHSNYLNERNDRKGNGQVRLQECNMSKEEYGNPVSDFFLGESAYLYLNVVSKIDEKVWMGIKIFGYYGNLISALNARQQGFSPTLKKGENKFCVHIPFLPLIDGVYDVSFTCSTVVTRLACDEIDNIMTITMHPTKIFTNGAPFKANNGSVYFDYKWIHVV